MFIILKVQPSEEWYMQLRLNEIFTPVTQDPISAALLRSRKTGKEFCNCCGGEMNFPLTTHIEDPIRFADGACYREGAGQTCAACEKKLLP